MSQNSSSKSLLLTDLSSYIYGTTRLGDDKIPFDERVKTARAAMNANIWFHTSRAYGNALEVLRAAFDQDRARLPNLIAKVGWQDINELRGVIHENIDPLGLDSLDIGQLCLSGPLGEDFATGGECYKLFSQFKQEGLVQRFLLEVYAWKPYLQQRAAEVAPIFERSGIQSWPEFCVRFIFGFPQVRATVGSTSQVDRLNEFLKVVENIQPLPADIRNEIIQLQYRWSDELDMKAEQWTM